ncbi:hypothetical protein GE09DRAFT_588709 [Coniochaeta sp. 2T2.1]|nr:hypothetical protein GE09DRAFT_588709 [Coniochaeta sp. 2T2.1]
MTRGLLSHYFQLQYRLVSIFHKDHFLQDTISGVSTHCSPLLVNAVLTCALVAASRIWQSRYNQVRDRQISTRLSLRDQTPGSS